MNAVSDGSGVGESTRARDQPAPLSCKDSSWISKVCVVSRAGVEHVKVSLDTRVEAISGGYGGYLIFLWKLSIFNFSFGMFPCTFHPNVLLSACCRGCREHRERARKHKGVWIQSAWAGRAKQGCWFFLLSFTRLPPTNALLLDKGGRIPPPSPPTPGNPGLLHCVPVLSLHCFHCNLKLVARLPFHVWKPLVVHILFRANRFFAEQAGYEGCRLFSR